MKENNSMAQAEKLPGNPGDTAGDRAKSVRELVRALDRASLASALPVDNSAAGGSGWPYASLVIVAVDHDLSPILLLSDLAEHTKAIKRDSRVSLLFDGTAGLAQPLTGPRVTLVGRAALCEDERIKARFIARHPDAAMYAGFKDFHFYRVAVERAHLVGGFGKIAWIESAELCPAPPPKALVESEEGIVVHMNEDHADAVALYASKLLKLPGEGWRMTGIDSEGLDLRSGGTVGRLALPVPVSGPEEARKALISLVTRARTG
jgi:putative heme iron utilization protein